MPRVFSACSIGHAETAAFELTWPASSPREAPRESQGEWHPSEYCLRQLRSHGDGRSLLDAWIRQVFAILGFPLTLDGVVPIGSAD